MMINPKKCVSYAKGGYCCTDKRNRKCKSECNDFALCKYRLKCHVVTNPNDICIFYKESEDSP